MAETRLENWYFDGVALSGVVYGHPRSAELPDGTFVRTSRVVEWGDGVLPAWAQTHNTRYVLGEPYTTEPRP